MKLDYLGSNADSITYKWCELGKVTSRLYAPISSFVKWGDSTYVYVTVVRLKLINT